MAKDDNQKAEDRTLVERFKQGDETAFDRLVVKYSGKAYQIAYGVLGNREDAEEVAQDVFLRIHRALPKFRGDSEFTTWMYRIAMNLARNKYRWNKSRGSHVNISIDAPIEGRDDGPRPGIDLPEKDLSPDERTALDELDKRAREELMNLPELSRQALVLRNIKELSYEAIAELLGCKLGTVKSRIARAREELRKRLDL
ncbi:MAG: sigma-70 family RNA polymerase sigma factor [Lentisphaeria bacterium]|nr:sigma-70 family RNA polymerase sigma factor [Lentisphaeria bacterium]